MGKLIKNHWARLIVLTAAICQSPHTPSSVFYTDSGDRPSGSSDRRLLLAQDLLGFPHEEPRPGSQAAAHPPDHQPDLRHLHVRVGMAARVPRRHGDPSQHRGPADRPPSRCSRGGLAVPGNESRLVLLDCDGGIFLGLQ